MKVALTCGPSGYVPVIPVGRGVGALGAEVGLGVGGLANVGAGVNVGLGEGFTDGFLVVGAKDGAGVGCVGTEVGRLDGIDVGRADGVPVGWAVGSRVGCIEG